MDQKYDKYYQQFLPINVGKILRKRVKGYRVNELVQLSFEDVKLFQFPEFDCYRLHCSDYSDIGRIMKMVRDVSG